MNLRLAPLAGLLLLAAALPAAETVPQKTTLEAAHSEFWSVEKETFFVFTSSPQKRVVLTGTDLRIVCDRLEITAEGLGDNGDSTVPSLERFKYLLATGNVVIMQGQREARCGRAEVFPRDNKIELTEKPLVIDHGNHAAADGTVDHGADYVTRGRKITMLRGQRRVLIDEPEFEGPPIRDLGFDARQPASSASPTPPAK